MTDPSEPKPWFVYLVRAANGALYCGISNDPVRRFASHQSGKGARFFLSSPAVAKAGLSGAALVRGNFSLEVTALASAQTLSSPAYAAATSAVGSTPSTPEAAASSASRASPAPRRC